MYKIDDDRQDIQSVVPDPRLMDEWTDGRMERWKYNYYLPLHTDYRTTGRRSRQRAKNRGRRTEDGGRKRETLVYFVCS